MISDGKRTAFGIIGTSLVFIIAMRSIASGQLETNFVIYYEEKPVIRSEGQTNVSKSELIDPSKEEFIYQKTLKRNFSRITKLGKSSTFNGTTTKPKKTKTNVLLVTAYRSGSTFLGELFNRNNDAFYLFEPLAAVGDDSLISQKHKYMSLLFDCQLPAIYRPVKPNQFKYGELTVNTLPENAIKAARPYRGECSRSNLCFREKHKWSCDKSICYGGEGELIGETVKRCSQCKPLNLTRANQICQERSITALKVIRYCNLNAINLWDNQLNIKTIVLFRDPRGIFVSRKSEFKDNQKALKSVSPFSFTDCS